MRQRERERRAEKQRQARIRKGFLGFIDRLIGKRKKTIALNQRETEQAQQRDYTEQANLRMGQAQALKAARKEVKRQTVGHNQIRNELQKDIQWLETPFNNASGGKKPIIRDRGRKQNREAPDYEPEP